MREHASVRPDVSVFGFHALDTCWKTSLRWQPAVVRAFRSQIQSPILPLRVAPAKHVSIQSP